MRRTVPDGQHVDIMPIIDEIRTAFNAARATESAPSGSGRSTSIILQMTVSIATEAWPKWQENTLGLLLMVNYILRLMAIEEK